MRTGILYLFLFALFTMGSCRTASYFETPNSLRNLHGVVFLKNGRSYEGKLVINNPGSLSAFLKLYGEGDKRPMRFPLSTVTGYQLGPDYFALKEVKGGIRLGRQFSFMKRLSPPDSRIHLFENREKRSSSNNRNTGNISYETVYYLQIPGEEESQVWPLNGPRFVPGFDKKMSRLLSDCPELARKIENKEDGYFYAQVTLFSVKRADVLLRIIEEYNACR